MAHILSDDELRQRLTDNNVKFHHRLGREKLVSLALEHEIAAEDELVAEAHDPATTMKEADETATETVESVPATTTADESSPATGTAPDGQSGHIPPRPYDYLGDDPASAIAKMADEKDEESFKRLREDLGFGTEEELIAYVKSGTDPKQGGNADATAASLLADLVMEDRSSWAKTYQQKLAKPDDEASDKRSIVPDKYKKKYGDLGHCGDELADVLKKAVTDPKTFKVDETTLVHIGDQNGINVNERWGHCNIGQRRMNLGNVLRGRLKKGLEVRVQDQVWNEGSTEATA